MRTNNKEPLGETPQRPSKGTTKAGGNRQPNGCIKPAPRQAQQKKGNGANGGIAWEHLGKPCGLEITVFSRASGALTKTISLKDGKPVSTGGGGEMAMGEGERTVIADLRELAAVIEGLKSFQAISLGTMRRGLSKKQKIVSEGKLDKHPGAIARTKQNFVYRKEKPALALFDFDRKAMPAPVRKKMGANAFWDTLVGILPELKGAAHLVRKSTSAGLYNSDTKERFPEFGGEHDYIIAEDGDDIERFLDDAHDRAWLHGFGWWMIGENGSLLERSIVDKSVGSSERLVFEGAPVLRKPLAQDAERRSAVVYDGTMVNTYAACLELTDAERREVDKIKDKARKKIQPKADKVRADYVERRAHEIAKHTGKPLAEARKVAEGSCSDTLQGDFLLVFKNKELGTCTVNDVLADPERFEKEALADPHAGVDYGKQTAKVYVKPSGEPWIKSFAHGGGTYSLVRTAVPPPPPKGLNPSPPPDDCYDDRDYEHQAPQAKSKKKAPPPPKGLNPQAKKDAPAQAAPEDDDDRRAEQIARNVEIGDEIDEPILPVILTLEEMIERFVYIGQSNAVVDHITGRIRKVDLAKTEYAASQTKGKKKPTLTINLWLKSTQRVGVDVLAWVPGQPQICAPPELTQGETTAFNSWRGLRPLRPPPPKNWKAQAKPFLDHIAFLVPIKSERNRFLQWLAHIVQRPEELPHTCYLMTTPKTGIGRNLLASMLTRALRGHVAASISLPELLDGGFNGRLSRKLLATVDEAREGTGDKRFARGERLKTIVNQEHRPINPKYGVQSVEKNCCRWLMFSNHVDALPFDNTDRRIWVIENPEERKPSAYYEKLFRLLDDKLFIASIRKLLETLDISTFRAGEHAPMNEAKKKALDFMTSDVERTVNDFKEDCKTELTSRETIREYIEEQLEDKRINEIHLTHAIETSGMISTGRRIPVPDAWGKSKRQSVVIVKADSGWTRELVQAALPDDLLDAMDKDNEVERALKLYKLDKLKSRTLVSRENLHAEIEAKLKKEITTKQLSVAIITAGMIATTRRVRFGKERYTVVIVKDWTLARVLAAKTEELLVDLALKPGTSSNTDAMAEAYRKVRF